MWYLRSSTQLIFTIVRSLSQITDQTRIPLPNHHLKYGKGWSRGCEFRGETWYNKVRYMRKFPFGSSICSRITICMRMYAMGQVRRCFVEPWGPRWCKCGNLILFFFLLQARNFECTSSEIDEIAERWRERQREEVSRTVMAQVQGREFWKFSPRLVWVLVRAEYRFVAYRSIRD